MPWEWADCAEEVDFWIGGWSSPGPVTTQIIEEMWKLAPPEQNWHTLQVGENGRNNRSSEDDQEKVENVAD